MARRKSIGIRGQLTSLLSARRLRILAREVGLVKRQRKVDVFPLFWTIVLGFGAGAVRTLGGLRREYEHATGATLVPSSFYARFTLPLAKLFRTVVTELLVELQARQERLRGVLAGFKNVFLVDATVVKLNALLSRAFPGTRGKAAAKLHVVMNVKGHGAHSVKLTSGRRHELKVLSVGPWVRNNLLLMDLGFFKYQLFDCIDRNGGYFISRLKANADPLIVAAHRRWRGQSVPVVGQRLSLIADRLERAVLDVEVEVAFSRRTYRGKQSGATRKLRLVGVFNEEAGRYHFYLTNVDVERLSAESVATTYGARWQVELLFHELKTHYRLEQIPSRKAHVAETFLMATVVTLLASRRLLAAVRSKLAAAERRVPEGRWASIFSTYASGILRLLVGPAAKARAAALYLEDVLFHEASDPNRSRPLLVDRVEFAVS